MKKLSICFFLLTLLMITSCSKGISSSTSSTTSIPVDQQEMEKKYEGILKDKKIYIANIGLYHNNFSSYFISKGFLEENVISKDTIVKTKEDFLYAGEVEPGAIVLLFIQFGWEEISYYQTSVEEEIARGKEFLKLQEQNIILSFTIHPTYLYSNEKYGLLQVDILHSLKFLDGITIYVFINDKYDKTPKTPTLGNYVQHMVKAYNPNLDYLQYDGIKHLETQFLPLLVKGIGE